MCIWKIEEAERKLIEALDNNSENKLLSVLKENSFLFHELYSRKFGIQPNFEEISFGDKMKCDFSWLNNNSNGSEWILVEVEAPKMRLFNKKWRSFILFKPCNRSSKILGQVFLRKSK